MLGMCARPDIIGSNQMKEVKPMEPMIIKFASTPEERAYMNAKMREYFQWCRQMNYDAANEENWNNFSESYNNR